VVELLGREGDEPIAIRAPGVDVVVAPPEQKILGLVNKPFGLKVVARSIVVAAVEGWPDAEAMAHSSAYMAAMVGSELESEDRAAGRSRNLLHTGLPTVEAAESLERFAVQYVGRVSKVGQVTPGAIVQFALAALVNGRIVLTAAGVEFARLASPILDGGSRPWQAVFSPEEQAFLVEHVMRFVPGEARDARAVVEAIQAGHSRPESLLVAVRPSLPAAWSDVQARSYLSGLVSRLAELDVISRVWTGRTVTYALSSNSPTVLRTGFTTEVVQ
jgi:hypothetical protein